MARLNIKANRPMGGSISNRYFTVNVGYGSWQTGGPISRKCRVCNLWKLLREFRLVDIVKGSLVHSDACKRCEKTALKKKHKRNRYEG